MKSMNLKLIVVSLIALTLGASGCKIGGDGSSSSQNDAAPAASPTATPTASPSPAASSSPAPAPTASPAPPTADVYGAIVTGPSSGLESDTCLKLTIQATDINGSPVTAAGDTAISMSDQSMQQGAFFTDSACSSPLPLASTMITAGTSTVDVYYRNGSGGAVNVGVSGNGLVNVTMWAATLAWAPPVTLAFDFVQPTAEDGSCSGPVIIGAYDANGGATILSATQDTTVAIMLAAGNTGNGQLYSDNGCTQQAGSVTISANQEFSGAMLYFKGTSLTSFQVSTATPALSAVASF